MNEIRWKPLNAVTPYYTSKIHVLDCNHFDNGIVHGDCDLKPSFIMICCIVKRIVKPFDTQETPNSMKPVKKAGKYSLKWSANQEQNEKKGSFIY